jgi:hypothetical protein
MQRKGKGERVQRLRREERTGITPSHFEGGRGIQKMTVIQNGRNGLRPGKWHGGEKVGYILKDIA